MSAQRFTVATIEQQAAYTPYWDHSHEPGGNCICDKPAAMLRAFALQTRQVEQMREWLDDFRSGDDELHDKFYELLPAKDGGQ